VSKVFGAIIDLITPVVGSFSRLQSALGTLRDAWVTGTVALEFSWNNFTDVAQLAGLKLLKFLVDMKDRIVWVFTEAIPSTLTWFADNWQSILTDVANFASTVFSNIADNIVNIITSLPELISGDKSFQDLWTPLTEGFKATVSELPDIAKKQESALAESLGGQVTALENQIGKDFSEFLAERLGQIDADAEAIREKFEGIKFTPPELPEVPELGQPGAGGAGEGGGAGGGGPSREGIEAVQLSRQFSGLQGRFAAGLEPQRQTARNTDRMVDQLKELNERMKEQQGQAGRMARGRRQGGINFSLPA
jgi:hypothetical protein